MEDKNHRILQEFSLLSRAEKQKQILTLVKRGTKSVMPILRLISSEDTDVQIRYLARKAMFHLKQRLGSEQEATDQTDFAKLKTLITDSNPDKVAKAIEVSLRRYPTELLSFLRGKLTTFQDPFTLSSVAIAFGRIGDQQDFNWIVSLLEHADSRVRASAVEALGCLGLKEGTPYLLKNLADNDNRIRANAIRALRLQDRKLVFESLSEMVFSKEVWMRNSAAFAIGEYRNDEVLDLLATLLQDSVESVRKMAFKALEKLSEKGVVKAHILKEHLSELKKSESINDFMSLVNTVAEDQTQQPSGLNSEDPTNRLAEISRIISSENIERYRELQERLMEEEDNYVAASLILALGRVKLESSAPLIRSFLNHPIPRIRANAIEALAKLGKRELLPEIILNLDDANNRARANAIVALKNFTYVDVITPLKQMVNSDKPKDQHSAFFAITELATPEAFHLLIPLAQKNTELQKNIRDFVLMTENDKPVIKEIKTQLQSMIDFSMTDDFVEELSQESTEDNLQAESTVLSEEDFDGFRADTEESGVKVESVNLEEFLVANAQQKLLMLDFLKKNQTQENFTILRYAEKDKDFQIKCMAKIALTAYKNLNFTLEEIKTVDIDRQGKIDINSLSFIAELAIDRQPILYGGTDPVAVLNQELKRRSLDFQNNGIWEGLFGVRNKLLCSLRLDTQEMLSSILGHEAQAVRAISFCYYAPTLKQYLEGVKSLDGIAYENYIQLNSEKARLIGEDLTDYVSLFVRAVPSPKYLLLLLTNSRLILFLRYTLAYKKSESVIINRSLIKSAHLEKEGFASNLILELDKDICLKLPKLHAKSAELILSELAKTEA